MPKDILLHDYDRVRSVSLEELLAERETLVQRALRYGRHALAAWALVSLVGALGAGALYAFGGSEEPILASQAEDAAPAEIPAPVDVAAAPEAAPLPQPKPVDTPTLAMMRPAEIAQPVIIEARLPRPRPDEPLTTGSIRVRGPYIPVARNEPCETLARLGIPFQLRIGCGRQIRYVAPPERRVYYQAY